MAEPGIEIRGVNEVVSLLKKLPESTFDETKAAFRDTVLRTDTRVQARFTSGPLHVRTGEGRRSFKNQVAGTTLDNLRASVFSGAVKGNILVYIPVLEFGARGSKAITAKRAYRNVPGGPYLNIPLPPNKTAAGVMRKTAGEVFTQGGFIFKSKKKNWIVAAKDGTPMFVLRKKVEIKPMLGFYDIADDETQLLISRLSSQLPQAWRKL